MSKSSVVDMLTRRRRRRKPSGLYLLLNSEKFIRNYITCRWTPWRSFWKISTKMNQENLKTSAKRILSLRHKPIEQELNFWMKFLSCLITSFCELFNWPCIYKKTTFVRTHKNSLCFSFSLSFPDFFLFLANSPLFHVIYVRRLAFISLL